VLRAARGKDNHPAFLARPAPTGEVTLYVVG